MKILSPGDEVLVRAIVRDVFPGEAVVQVEMESPRLNQRFCVHERNIEPRKEQMK